QRRAAVLPLAPHGKPGIRAGGAQPWRCDRSHALLGDARLLLRAGGQPVLPALAALLIPGPGRLHCVRVEPAQPRSAAPGGERIPCPVRLSMPGPRGADDRTWRGLERSAFVLARRISCADGDRHRLLPLSPLPFCARYAREARLCGDGASGRGIGADTGRSRRRTRASARIRPYAAQLAAVDWRLAQWRETAPIMPSVSST